MLSADGLINSVPLDFEPSPDDDASVQWHADGHWHGEDWHADGHWHGTGDSNGHDPDTCHGGGCACPECLAIQQSHDHAHGEPEFLYDSRGIARFYDPPYQAAQALASDASTDGTELSGDSEEEKIPLSETPKLHSYPDAPNVLYLDFDGEIIQKTDWNLDYDNRPIHAAPFDVDGDRETWSETELAMIREVWLRVSEDFAPFEINVTTEEPPADLINNPRGAMRALITTNVDDEQMGGTGDKWHIDVGGVAYTSSWVIPDQAPVWSFYNLLPPTAKGIAEATSHEFGHAFGLVHHGQGIDEYYEGHGEGETSWAPIMGTGYTSNVTQWSRGEYSNANNPQDDFELITNALLNRIEFREDDIFQGNDAAEEISVVDGEVFASGVIAEEWDYDTLSFEHPGGLVNLHIAPASVGPNLDVLVTLFDDDADEVAQFDPLDSLDVWLQTELDPGTYFLDVEGGRFFPEEGEGYSDYGSVGSYTISGHVGTPPLTVIAGGEYGWREDTLLYRIDQGEGLILDASSTYGPSGQLGFAWDIDGDGVYNDAFGANASITWEQLVESGIRSGEYELSVQVSDDMGNVEIGTSILEVQNLRPIIEATEPREVLLAERTRFEVQASDSPGDTLSYEWKVYSVDLLGEVEIANVDSGSDSFLHYSFDEPGTYEVRVRVSDDAGGQRVSVIPVTVLNENPVPSIVEASISDGASLSELSTVVFSFNQDVSASLDVTNLVVFDNASNFPIDLSGGQVTWDADTFSAEYQFNALPTGSYLVTLDDVMFGNVGVDGDGDGFADGQWSANITIEAESLAGDVNLDGAVDFADFLLLSQNFGSDSATAEEGDLNDDGVIDFADFLILSQDFGAN